MEGLFYCRSKSMQCVLRLPCLPIKIRPMKTIKKISMVILTIASVIIPAAGTASDDAISIQKMLLGASSEKKTADASIEVVVMIPDVPQIKPITFEDEAKIPYTLSEGFISIAASDVPVLYASLNDIPASFKPITIALRPEGEVKVSWDESGALEVQDMNIRVRIYKKKKGEISASTKPIVDFLLKDVAVSTKEADAEYGVFIFQWDATFPKVGNDLFDSYLAGKTIDALVTINAK